MPAKPLASTPVRSSVSPARCGAARPTQPITARGPLAANTVAAGTLGAVAAASRTAAAIGSATLLAGGSAIDAALAAALAETVLLPPKCGLAGDLIALILPAGAAEPLALTAIGPAAAGLADAAAAAGWQMSPTGPLAVGVPGAPAGYAALAQQGRLGLAALTSPAIALAERGVVWSAVNERLAREAGDLLRRHQPEGSVYLTATTGDHVRLPGLARLLREFTELGADLFSGPAGAAVVDYVQRHGGVLTRADLSSAEAEYVPAMSGEVEGRRLWATPDPTYGPALLDALSQRSGARPDVVRAALDRLGDRAPDGGTSAVAATDAEGTAVVIVHSNSFPQFGSGLVVPGYDLVLSNRAGRGFTFRPGHPNAPASGRRPRTTLHAWGLSDEHGRPALLGATPGGEQQVPWNAQLLDTLIAAGASDDGLDGAVADALTSARWEFLPDGRVKAEVQADPEVPPLPADVHAAMLSARSSHVVVRPLRNGTLAAAADPRQGGTAVAL